MITPKQVFDCWRDNDLLGFDPPHEGETYPQYCERVGEEGWPETGCSTSPSPSCAARTFPLPRRATVSSVPPSTC